MIFKIFLCFLITINSWAVCNPKTDIVQQGEVFIYKQDCHLEFGKLKQQEESRQKEVEYLRKSIELKDLALDTSNERIKNWQEATYKIEDRLLKYEKNSESLKWIYFGLGILVMGGAVYGAAQINR